MSPIRWSPLLSWALRQTGREKGTCGIRSEDRVHPIHPLDGWSNRFDPPSRELDRAPCSFKVEPAPSHRHPSLVAVYPAYRYRLLENSPLIATSMPALTSALAPRSTRSIRPSSPTREAWNISIPSSRPPNQLDTPTFSSHPITIGHPPPSSSTSGISRRDDPRSRWTCNGRTRSRPCIGEVRSREEQTRRPATLDRSRSSAWSRWPTMRPSILEYSSPSTRRRLSSLRRPRPSPGSTRRSSISPWRAIPI